MEYEADDGYVVGIINFLNDSRVEEADVEAVAAKLEKAWKTSWNKSKEKYNAVQ